MLQEAADRQRAAAADGINITFYYLEKTSFPFTYCVWHLNSINESLKVVIRLHADDVINDLIHLKQQKTGTFGHAGCLT